MAELHRRSPVDGKFSRREIMRNVRMLVALAVMAIAAMAFAASASAQTLSITDENTGAACSNVTVVGTDVNGGCLIHANSEGTGVELRKHVFGIESHITRCNNEFTGRVSGGATGQIFEQVLTNTDTSTCTRQACASDGEEGEKNPWAASGSEKVPAPTEPNDQITVEGGEYLTTSFCVEPIHGGTNETCEIDVPFQSYDETDHRQEFGHATELDGHGIGGFKCELIGHWNTELGGVHDGQAEQDVAVTHLN